MSYKAKEWHTGDMFTPEDATEMSQAIEDNEVVANPELEGTEQELTGLEVEGTKYKMPEGGTQVVANPELEGNEPNLTGLEVEGTKYKMPQGGGSVGGTFLFPLAIVSKELVGFNKAVIDSDALIDYLKDCGIDVEDTPFENLIQWSQGISLHIGVIPDSNSETQALVNFWFQYLTGNYQLDVSWNGDIIPSGSYTFNTGSKFWTLRQAIENIFAVIAESSDNFVELPSLTEFGGDYASNMILIEHYDINEIEKYNINNADEFFKGILVEYTPDSSDYSY